MMDEELRSPVDEKLFAQATEVFTIFDKDQDGSIMVEEIGAAFRSVGFNPTEKEIEDIREELEKQGEFVDFRSFLELVSRYRREGDSYTEVLEAFRVFDPNRTGYVSALELRLVMMQTGERLTEHEADGLIAYADIDRRGNIRYVDFAKKLLSE